MSEKLILSIHITEWKALNKRMYKDEAQGMLNSIWNKFKDRDLACFHCNNTIDVPPKTEITVNPVDFDQVYAAPLCLTCSTASSGDHWDKTKVLVEQMCLETSDWLVVPFTGTLKKKDQLRVPPSTIPVNKRWHIHDKPKVKA